MSFGLGSLLDGVVGGDRILFQLRPKKKPCMMVRVTCFSILKQPALKENKIYGRGNGPAWKKHEKCAANMSKTKEVDDMRRKGKTRKEREEAG